MEELRRRGHAVQCPRLRVRVSDPETAGSLTAESTRICVELARLRVQYGGKLRDQYQLAGLRWRNHNELSVADAGTERTELPFGRDGHRRFDCSDSWIHSAQRRDDRQFLGRPDTFDSLRSAAPFDCPCTRAGVSGCRPELSAVSVCCAAAAGQYRRTRYGCGRYAVSRRGGKCNHTRESDSRTTVAHGPSGVADRDQTTRNEWWWILQRELGASIRKPNSAVELSAATVHSGDPRIPVLDVWRYGWRPSTGLGDSHGNAGDLCAAGDRRCGCGAIRSGVANRHGRRSSGQ